jgi:hypothetical protein
VPYTASSSSQSAVAILRRLTGIRSPNRAEVLCASGCAFSSYEVLAWISTFSISPGQTVLRFTVAEYVTPLTEKEEAYEATRKLLTQAAALA